MIIGLCHCNCDLCFEESHCGIKSKGCTFAKPQRRRSDEDVRDDSEYFEDDSEC